MCEVNSSDQELYMAELDAHKEELKKLMPPKGLTPPKRKEIIPRKIARKSAPVTTGVHKPYCSPAGRVYEKFRECL